MMCHEIMMERGMISSYYTAISVRSLGMTSVIQTF